MSNVEVGSSEASAPVYPKKLAVKEPKVLKAVAAKEDDKAEVSGRVESISVKNEGASDFRLFFSLKSKKGKKADYFLDRSQPERFAVLANVLSAAYVSGAKIHLRSLAGASPRAVTELEIHARK